MYTASTARVSGWDQRDPSAHADGTDSRLDRTE
jgi:hypothetical protein